MSKNSLYITILILIAIILLLTTCNGKKCKENTVFIDTSKITIETKWDTLKISTLKYKPVYKVKYKHDTLYKNIDTAGVIDMYFDTYGYVDTVGTDSVKAIIIESITKNQIKSRQVNFEIKYPVKIITKTLIKNNRQLFIGGGISGNTSDILSFGPSIAYKTKNNYLYSLNAGLLGSTSPSLNISIYKKLGK